MATTTSFVVNDGILQLPTHSLTTTTTPTPDDKEFFRQQEHHHDPKPAILSDEVKELALKVNKLFIEIFFVPKKGNELSQQELWVLYKGLLPVMYRLDVGFFGRLRNAYHTKGNFSLKLKENDTVAVTTTDSAGNQRAIVVKPTTPPKSKKKADGTRFYMDYALKLNGHGDAGSQSPLVRELCAILKISECNFDPDTFKKVVHRTLLRKEAYSAEKANMFTADVEFGDDGDNHVFLLTTPGQLEYIRGKYLEPNSEQNTSNEYKYRVLGKRTRPEYVNSNNTNYGLFQNVLKLPSTVDFTKLPTSIRQNGETVLKFQKVVHVELGSQEL